MGFSILQFLFERLREAETGFLENPNPTVLSCGGIYLPRRKLPAKVVFQVLNLANNQEPIKIYTGRHGKINLLQEVLSKEILN